MINIFRKPRCYRCNADATVKFAGLDYCRVCRDIVNTMWAAVQHDPPYGFPGAKGYLPDGPTDKEIGLVLKKGV